MPRYDSAAQERRDGAIHESFLRHRNFRYLKVAVFLSAVAVVGYFLHDSTPRPNGGTWLGYTLGSISALLIMWLTWLGVRKRNISPGKWSLKSWTSAHVYLGLSLIVLATLHTGFQFGWNVHTLAYGVMMVVILSGIFGIYVYATVPTKMGANRSRFGTQGDTREQLTREQMILELNSIDRQLTQLAQPLSAEASHFVSQSILKTRVSRGWLNRLSRRIRGDVTDQALTRLRSLSNKVDGAEREAFKAVIDTLERKQAMLVQVRRHVRYKSILELWLYIHVPMTFLLLAALIAHIISVFFYW